MTYTLPVKTIASINTALNHSSETVVCLEALLSHTVFGECESTLFQTFSATSHGYKVLSVPFSLYRTFIITIFFSSVVHRFTLPCLHCHHFFHCLFIDLLYHAFIVIISFIVCSHIYPCFHCHHFFHCLFIDLLYHAFIVIISFIVCS